MPELMTEKSMKELDHEAAELWDKVEARDEDRLLEKLKKTKEEGAATKENCILYHFGCRAC